MDKFKEYLSHCKLDAKPYQEFGVKWCLERESEKNKIKGGIIADEMGLGKTIQMIGLMHANPVEHTLIVLPPVLMDQWYAALSKTKIGPISMYHRNYKNQPSIHTSKVVITTYFMIISKTSGYALRSIKWDRIIFDEAHHLRNKKTQKFKACKEFKKNNTKMNVWLVTGTPIQNKLNDLINLLNILGVEEQELQTDTEIMKQVDNFVLKRTKKEVGIKLPECKIENIYVDWKNKNEEEISEDIHQECGFTKSNRTTQRVSFKDGSILTQLLRARQMCIAPSIIRKSKSLIYDESENKEIENGFQCSSKLQNVVDKIIKSPISERKIVFCHFIEEINILKSMLTKHYKRQTQTVKIEHISGTVKQKDRKEIMVAEDIDILILQINVGCEGLNLQQYNEIYFVSLHWNPAVEDQAIARCHRIGQTKPVKIYRFIMKNFSNTHNGSDGSRSISFEEYVDQKQAEKRELSNEFFENMAPKTLTTKSNNKIKQ